MITIRTKTVVRDFAGNAKLRSTKEDFWLDTWTTFIAFIENSKTSGTVKDFVFDGSHLYVATTVGNYNFFTTYKNTSVEDAS